MHPVAINKTTLALKNSSGATLLTYGQLSVRDARGRTIAAHLVAHGTHVQIEFNDRGATYPLVVDPTTTEQTELTASDGAANDLFGTSVALSSNGLVAIVGASFHNVGSLSHVGAAYIFSGTNWSTVTELEPSTESAGSYFGNSVALSSDGSVAIVTAYEQTESGHVGAGAAYIFSGTSWSTQTALTIPSNALANAVYFGTSASISGDGTTALVSAYQTTVNGVASYGSAYIYTAPAWTLTKTLEPSGITTGGLFGSSTALSNNGSVALVSAEHLTVSGHANQGEAFIFSGTNWSTQTNLTSSDGLASDYFGAGVALSSSGTLALVGAYNHKVGTHAAQGSAYFYSGTNWSTQTEVTASDGAANDYFGNTVALSGDGTTALISAYHAVGSHAKQGVGYLYTGTNFGTQTEFSSSDGAASDYFSSDAVSLSSNGSQALVGAFEHKVGANAGQGSAYVFTTIPSATNSTITASPTSISANGTSTSTITVQVKDPYGNNVTTGGLAVTLATTAGTLGAVTDNGNGTYSATLTSSTAVTVASVTGTVNGIAIGHSAAVAFAGLPSATNSTIVAAPTSIAANGTSTSTITVQAKDANSNNVTTGGATVTLSSTLGTISSVTDNGNGTYSAILTSSSTSGTATITGTLNGTAIGHSALVQMVGTASGPNSIISTSPSSVSANGTTTSTITVQAVDTTGRSLTTGGASVVLSSTLGTISSVTDNGNGTYSATITSSTPGTATITGTINTATIGNSATVVFVGPVSSSTSTLSATPRSVSANGTSSAAIIVQLKDASGTNLTTGGASVVLSSTLGTISSVTDNGNGTYSATITSSTPGTATITGNVAGVPISSSALVTFVGLASPSQSVISASPTSITANGTTTSIVTVQLKDVNAHNLTQSGGTVLLFTSLGTLGSVTDNGNGTYSATLTSSTLAGTATITGTINGTAIGSNATVTFIAGTPSATNTTVVASPTTGVTVNATTTTTSGNYAVVTVTVLDTNSNGVSGSTVTLSGSGNALVYSALSGSTLSGLASSVTTNSSGVAVFYVVDLTAETATFTATASGVTIAQQPTVAFIAGTPSATNTTVVASPTTGVTVNATTTTTSGNYAVVTVTVKDASGNLVSGSTVTLSGSAGSIYTSDTSNTLSGSGSVGVTTGANGQAVFYVVDTVAQTDTYTAVAGGVTIAQQPTVAFIAGTPSATNTTVVASPTTGVTVNATTTTTSGNYAVVTVTVKDASGNLVSGSTVTLSGSAGSIYTSDTSNTLSGSGSVGVTTGANGQAVFYVVDTVAQTDTYTAVAGGVTITQQPTVAFIAGTPSATNTTVVASPTTGVTVNATTTTTSGNYAVVTVTVKDASGNLVSGSTVTLSGSAGSIYTSDTSNTLSGSGSVGVTTGANGQAVFYVVDTVAQTDTYTAVAGGVTITQQPTVAFIAGTPSATNTTVVASPTTGVTVNATTTTTSGNYAVVTVTVKDASGNLVSGSTVTLSGSGNALVYSALSGSTLSGLASSVTTNSSGVAVFYVVDLTAETATFTATASGVTITQQPTVAFIAGPANASNTTVAASPTTGVTLNATTTTTSGNYAVVTVTVKDASGNLVSGSTVTLSGSAGSIYTSDTSNTLSGSGSVGVTTGANGQAVFYVVDTVAQTDTYTAVAGGVTIAQQPTVAFIAGTPSATNTTVVASPTTGVTVNATTTTTSGNYAVVTVTVKDASGNLVSGSTVTLSGSAGSIYTSDTSNTLSGSGSVGVTTGANGQAVFYVVDTVAQTDTYTAVAGGVTITQQPTVAFIAGTPSATNTTVVASPTTGVTVNATTTTTSGNYAVVTVTVKDASGNLVSGSTVTLSGSAGSIYTSDTSNTLSGSGSVGVTTGANGQAVFYVVDTVAQTDTYTAVAGGVTITQQPTVAFIAGTPTPVSGGTSTITISTTIVNVATGHSTVTVTLKDSNSNPVPGQSITLSGLTGSSTIAISPMVTNSSGVAQFNVSDNVAETVQYQAIDTTSALTVGNSPFVTFVAVTPTTTGVTGGTSITTSATQVQLDTGSSVITVTLVDAFGNPVANQSVTLVGLSGSSRVSSASTSYVPGTVTTNSSGVATFYVSDTSAETVTFSASDGSLVLGDSAAVSFVAGAVSGANSVIMAAPSSVSANGVSTTAVTVTLKDANGNALTYSGGTVALSTTLGTISSVTDNGDGTYSATLSSSFAGSATITGTINGSTAIGNSASVLFVGVVSGTNSLINASPSSIAADGSSTSVITVTLKDTNDSPLTAGGDVVVLSTTLGTIGTITDNGDGTYSTTLTSSATPGVATITGTVNGISIANDAIVIFIGPASGANSTIVASPPLISANGTSTSVVTVTLKDATGHRLTQGGDTVVLSTNAGALGAVTDNGDGTYSATLTSSTTPGVATITGTVGGSNIGASARVVFVGPASPVNSSIAASPATISANGTSTSTISVQAVDASGNTLTTGGATVTIATTSGTVGPVTDNLNGTYSATLTSSTTVGTATITGTIGGVAIGNIATVDFVAGAPASGAGSSSIVASLTSVVADGSTYSTVTVTLKDVYGNLVSGDTISLTTLSSTANVVTILGTTGANGVATFEVTDSTAENISFNAIDTTDSNFAIGSINISFTPVPAPPPTATPSFSAPPVITTTSLPSPSLGSPYSATLSETGGTGPFVWSASGLPAGLSINTTTGTISGTPTTTNATQQIVTVTVTDARGQFESENFVLGASGTSLLKSVTGATALGGDSQVLVHFTPSSNASSFTGVTYSVTAGPGGATCTTTGSSCLVTGLTNGVTYSFTVIASATSPAAVSSAASTSATPTPTPIVVVTPGGNGTLGAKPFAELLPGQASVTKLDGSSSSVNVIATHTSVTASGDNLTMTISAASTIATPSGYTVILVQGGFAQVSGEGFLAGTYLDVYAFSQNIILGKVLVKSNGTYDALLPIPATLSVGNHTVLSQGFVKSGARASVSVGVVVQSKDQAELTLYPFAVASSQLTLGMMQQLKTFVALLKKDGVSKITITGYTDSSGDAAYNFALGTRRATSVATSLETIFDHLGGGLNRKLVSTRSLGLNAPAATNATPSGRARNRNVTIVAILRLQ